MLAGKGVDPTRVTATRKAPLDNVSKLANGTPEIQKVHKKKGVPIVKEITPQKKQRKHIEVQPPPAIPSRFWDAESTGSNTDECEACEQLKRSAADNKYNKYTAAKKSRTTVTHEKHQPKKHRDAQPAIPIRQWDADSNESMTGDAEQIEALAAACAKTTNRHNNLTLAVTKKLLKNSKLSKGFSYLLNGSGVSTPRRYHALSRSSLAEAIKNFPSPTVKNSHGKHGLHTLKGGKGGPVKRSRAG